MTIDKKAFRPVRCAYILKQNKTKNTFFFIFRPDIGSSVDIGSSLFREASVASESAGDMITTPLTATPKRSGYLVHTYIYYKSINILRIWIVGVFPSKDIAQSILT